MNIFQRIKRKYDKNIYHPATTMSFNKLYKGLMERVDIGLINVQRGLGLEIFSYSKSCVYEGAWDKFTLMARGLILDPQNKRITGLCFPKFFNWGEVSTKLPDLPFTTSTKLDGSFGLVFYHKGKWQVATKGSFQSEQAVWATDYLNQYGSLANMDTDITYLTEIIAPWNKIVVSYSFEGLVLLSGYHLSSGLELTRREIETEATAIGCQVVEEVKYDSLDEMIEIAETLDVNNEGFVVRFSNGYRIKIKGSEYCRVHRLISNCTPLAIWDMMRNLDDLDVIRVDLPEEHQKDFDSIRDLLQKKFDWYVAEIKDFHEKTKDLPDKYVGMNLKTLYGIPAAKTFVFACRKKNFLEEVYMAPDSVKHARRALFEKFRPTGNVLEGFIPSSAMNRFDEESL
ncbi:2'-5' RNA ligase [candidate division WWE3 bacterium]|jgi:RNA ligase|nr:2'-5' RNA ligase [candidate division WWE3 bacterium]